jgi:aspartyl/asparaginyl-tRNA synthetase
VLRDSSFTLQCVLAVNATTVSRQMVKFVANVTKESLVDVAGRVELAPAAIASCTQSQVELQVTQVHLVSAAVPRLPLQVEDAARRVEEGGEGGEEGQGALATVNQDTRLDHRVLDLRTVTNQAIYRVQAAVCRLFRDHLTAEGFVEVQTPKLISAASEGGSMGCQGMAPCFGRRVSRTVLPSAAKP